MQRFWRIWSVQIPVDACIGKDNYHLLFEHYWGANRIVGNCAMVVPCTMKHENHLSILLNCDLLLEHPQDKLHLPSARLANYSYLH